MTVWLIPVGTSSEIVANVIVIANGTKVEVLQDFILLSLNLKYYVCAAAHRRNTSVWSSHVLLV